MRRESSSRDDTRTISYNNCIICECLEGFHWDKRPSSLHAANHGHEIGSSRRNIFLKLYGSVPLLLQDKYSWCFFSSVKQWAKLSLSWGDHHSHILEQAVRNQNVKLMIPIQFQYLKSRLTVIKQRYIYLFNTVWSSCNTIIQVESLNFNAETLRQTVIWKAVVDVLM